jgi:hypothetical protein
VCKHARLCVQRPAVDALISIDDERTLRGLLCGALERIGQSAIDPNAGRIGARRARVVPANRSTGDDLSH